MRDNDSAAFDRVKADVAEKVRKLLNQAEDPAATAEEAAAFTAKAQQLMTKYAIDLVMVADTRVNDQVVVRGWRIQGPYSAYKVGLVNAAGRANDCRAIYTDLGGGAKKIDVVGFPHDVDWVETLSRSLELQLTTAMAAAARSKPSQVHGRTYSAGFAQGFVDEVSTRLHRVRRQGVADAAAAWGAGLSWDSDRPSDASGASGASVALVLARKDQRVEDEYRVRFPHSRTVRRSVRLGSWSGYEPGREAGRRAGLARAPLSGRPSLSA